MKYKFLTEKQIEEWLGVPIATLRTKRSRPGKDPIPYTKVMGRVRYREDLVLKWLEDRTYDSTDPGKKTR